MRPCADHRDALVAFIRGDLGPLEEARLAAHLERCAECRDLQDRLRRALSTAREWKPSIDAEHLARLERRLALTATAPQRPRLRIGLVLVPALAASIALVVGLGLDADPEGDDSAPTAVIEATPPPSAPPRDAPGGAGPPAPAARAPVELARAKLTPRLHAVSGDRWDGRVTHTSPRDVRVDMQRGFAVMAFRGGEGRTLTVVAPRVSVEVIGTQFFVRVLDDGATAVGVLSGRVRVVHDGGSEVLDAGAARRYVEGRPPELAPPEVHPPVDASDPFLADHGHEVVALEAPPDAALEPVAPRSSAAGDRRRTPQRAAVAPSANAGVREAPPTTRVVPPEGTAREAEAVSPEPQEHDPTPSPPAVPAAKNAPAAPMSPEQEALGPNTVSGVLEEAERATRAGRFDAAVAVLRAASARSEAAFVAKRALLRYELGRILAFDRRAPGDAAAARALFRELADHAGGEVARQSRLALCELALSRSPCEATACLEKLRRESDDADLRAEAEVWAARWRSKKSNCEDQK